MEEVGAGTVDCSAAATWDAEVAAVRAAEAHRQTVQARQRLPGPQSQQGVWEQRQQDTWGIRGAVGAEEQVQEEYLNALMEEVGAGTVDCITAAKWDADCGRAVVPISGVNTTDEPMVFRAGQRVAEATKLHSSSVNNIGQQRTAVGTEEGLYTSSCDEGTTTDNMITDTDHEASDWRAGLSWKEVTDMTRSGPRNEEFKA